MKRKLTKRALLVLLTLLTAIMLLNGTVKANPFTPNLPTDPNSEPSKIAILSPATTLYVTDNLPVNITVGLPQSATASSTYILYVYYKLDYQPNCTLIYNITSTGQNGISSHNTNPEKHIFTYSGNLPKVPAGAHTITVYAISSTSYFNSKAPDMHDTYMLTSNSTATFTVINTSSNQTNVLAIAAVAIVIALSSFLVYFKKIRSNYRSKTAL
jgi:hypothetical protein